jgi:hypothetical protein
VKELGANKAARAKHQNWSLKLSNSRFETRIDIQRDLRPAHNLSVVGSALKFGMRFPAPMTDPGPIPFDGISAIRIGPTDIRARGDV